MARVLPGDRAAHGDARARPGLRPRVHLAAARAVDFAAERDRTLRMLLELVRRAKESGALREDFVVADISLALMANEGIRAETPRMRVAASRRFAAFMIQSFRAEPVRPAAPAVRLPLSATERHPKVATVVPRRRCRPPP
ncbi:hypothetical protein NKH77_27665 [Streptomyces sp. M19]